MNATNQPVIEAPRTWSKPLLLTGTAILIAACLVPVIGLWSANFNDTVIQIVTTAIGKTAIGGAVFAAVVGKVNSRRKGWGLVAFALWCLIWASVFVYNFREGAENARARIQAAQAP